MARLYGQTFVRVIMTSHDFLIRTFQERCYDVQGKSEDHDSFTDATLIELSAIITSLYILLSINCHSFFMSYLQGHPLTLILPPQFTSYEQIILIIIGFVISSTSAIMENCLVQLSTLGLQIFYAYDDVEETKSIDWLENWTR